MLRKIKELNLLSVTSDVCVKGIYDNPAIALVEKYHRIRASEANMQNENALTHLHKQPGGWIDTGERVTMNTPIYSGEMDAVSCSYHFYAASWFKTFFTEMFWKIRPYLWIDCSCCSKICFSMTVRCAYLQ